MGSTAGAQGVLAAGGGWLGQSPATVAAGCDSTPAGMHCCRHHHPFSIHRHPSPSSAIPSPSSAVSRVPQLCWFRGQCHTKGWLLLLFLTRSPSRLRVHPCVQRGWVEGYGAGVPPSSCLVMVQLSSSQGGGAPTSPMGPQSTRVAGEGVVDEGTKNRVGLGS